MSLFNSYPLLTYLLPLAAIWIVISAISYRRNAKVLNRKHLAIEAGLTEPASLHPVIDPNLCLGCASCVKACPEGDILGLVDGKAQLVEPANCIGHGACQKACPLDAISLVFGSATRGVDIPTLKANFETSVSGIFIAGELGGMGLIRNAIEQGVQAAGEVARYLKGARANSNDSLDLVIVGAGPAGIAASLKAKKEGLKFVTIDQDTFGGTVSHFPRNKIVMTAPVDLPLVGKIKIRETSKEALLELWHNVIEQTQLSIQFNQRMENIEASSGGFRVTTNQGQYDARSILLCMGRRGTPRKLGVEGEDSAKVVYRLIDPEQYQQHDVLVVGGGDSAIEAAVSIAEHSAKQVTLCYRGAAFNRVKPKNRESLQQAEHNGKVRVLLESNVLKITPKSVEIERHQKVETIPNDAVIICAGGILPTPFLQKIGIQVETKHGSS